MPEKKRVEVEILGRRHTIRSDAAPEYVQELAAFVDQRAREIQGGNTGEDPSRVLALAALYIADELFRRRDDQAVADKDTGARLGALSRLLDSVAAPGDSA